MDPSMFTKDSYNNKTVLAARTLEKLTARIFNLRCLANKVIPKTLQIKWKGNKFEQAIMKKAEHSLINNRIKYTNIKINHLQTEIANTKTSLQQKLDESTFTNLQNTTTTNMASKTTNTFNTAVPSSTSSSIQEKSEINLSKDRTNT